MKKVIILILFTFLFVPDIHSQTLTNVLPLNKSITINKVEERYKWYKLKKVNEHYENSVEHSCEYFEDVNSDFNDWSLIKPEEKNNRIIEEKIVNIDLSNKTYNTLMLDNFIVEFLEVKEIVLTNASGIKIPFALSECINCNKSEAGNLLLNKDSKVILKLNNNYTEIIQIEIRFEKDNNILFWKSTLLLDKYPVRSLGVPTLGKMGKVCSTNYCSYKAYAGLIWEEYSSYEEKYYRYKDTFVNCYYYEKEYINGYFSNYDGYIKDENTKMYFYEYKLNNNNIIYKDKTEEEKYNEDNSTIAINYGSKTDTEDYSNIPIFIIALGGILILLILICRKIRLNLKNGR